MIKKIVSLFLVLILIMTICSCEKNKDIITLCSYDELYNGESTTIHESLINQDILNRASYGYRFNNTQGYNSWYFSVFIGDIEYPLEKQNNDWIYQDNVLTNDGYITTNNCISLCYKSPKLSLYHFGGTLLSNNDLNVNGKLEVFVNNSIIKTYNVDSNDKIGIYIEEEIDLNYNDLLSFRITGNDVYFNPVVSTTNLNYSLYTSDNDWKYYGDLHGYYYNNQFYLYHLWNHTGNDSGWAWYMKTSNDMFRYKNAGYDDSFVNNHYMKQGSWPDIFLDEYTSSRDRTYFYDEDVKRYRAIGLCYCASGGCVLALKTSDDEMGLSWTTPSVVLRDFTTQASGEPECSQLLKINNRWYLSCGISSQSIHGVGGISYWFGESNKTIDEIDWKNLETNRLDGDDLAVPQIEKIKDRYYLYGWMPYSYNSGCWGGYKNLSREVYTLDNGLLAARIDECATKLLNKGSYFNPLNTSINNLIIDNNYIKVSNTAGLFNNIISSHLTIFSVDMTNSNKFSYVIKQNDKYYYVTIIKTNNGIYLEVTDSYNFQSSELLLTKENINKFDCKIIVDGSNIEFGVNDIKVLSARTGMNNIDSYDIKYQVGFVSDNNVTISNLSINRLAQNYDIYD